ncbi:MAG TPA: hypothetical protein VF681_06575 [Abditibacteriaceae bacterium]|jgi:hypothetical protein
MNRALFLLLIVLSVSARAENAYPPVAYPPSANSPIGTAPPKVPSGQPTGFEPAPVAGLPRAVVRPYGVDDAEFSAGRNWRSWFSSSIDEEAIGESVARSVADAVRRAGRFNVSQIGSPSDWNDLAPSRFPAEADFVLDGRIDKLDIETKRVKNKSRDKDSRDRRNRDDDESWSVAIEMTVRHRARRSDGEIWRQIEVEKTATHTFSSRPRVSAIEDMIEDAARDTASGWARMLVQEKRGRIVGREGTLVNLDLGRRDGVGMDVDFFFERPEGEGFSRVAARPDAKKDAFVCIARPVRVDEASCVVEIGYNGSGGLFGPDVKWKKRAEMTAALRTDDIAILTPRAYGAK